MSRCYTCCQENCAYTYTTCGCQCHDRDHVYVPITEETKPATLKDEIRAVLDARKLQTATEISAQTTGHLSSVSSALNKMVKAGEVLRLNAVGIRGGYGYVLAVRKKRA